MSLATLASEFISSQKASDEFEACRAVVKKHFCDVPRGQLDLKSLAKQRGIIVQECRETPFEGMIERDGNGIATITLRTGLNRRRERFTLAHELGHWLLQEEMLGTIEGKLFRGVSKNPAEVKDEERLASLIAAEILMPFEPLERLLGGGCSLQTLHHVCREFGVSRTAAIRRIADITNMNLLLLQIVPFRFDHLDSIAEIDDALFASARTGTLFARERTRFVERLPFSQIVRDTRCSLAIRSPKGLISSNFEIDYRPTPIPHAFTFACGQVWH